MKISKAIQLVIQYQRLVANYSGLVRCSFRYLDMLKHLIFSLPKIGCMVLSGVNNFFTTCGRETCSPLAVPMIFANSLDTLSGFWIPVAFLSLIFSLAMQISGCTWETALKA